jgi:hypothetical protein
MARIEHVTEAYMWVWSLRGYMQQIGYIAHGKARSKCVGRYFTEYILHSHHRKLHADSLIPTLNPLSEPSIRWSNRSRVAGPRNVDNLQTTSAVPDILRPLGSVSFNLG